MISGLAGFVRRSACYCRVFTIALPLVTALLSLGHNARSASRLVEKLRRVTLRPDNNT
jgi:hypothetical protein